MDIKKMKKDELVDYVKKLQSDLSVANNESRDYLNKLEKLRKEAGKVNENVALVRFAIDAQLASEFPEMAIFQTPPECLPENQTAPASNKWYELLVCLNNKLIERNIGIIRSFY